MLSGGFRAKITNRNHIMSQLMDSMHVSLVNWIKSLG